MKCTTCLDLDNTCQYNTSYVLQQLKVRSVTTVRPQIKRNFAWKVLFLWITAMRKWGNMYAPTSHLATMKFFYCFDTRGYGEQYLGCGFSCVRTRTTFRRTRSVSRTPNLQFVKMSILF